MSEHLANQQGNVGSNPTPRIDLNKNYSNFLGKFVEITFYDHFDINEWETIKKLKEEDSIELTGLDILQKEKEIVNQIPKNVIEKVVQKEWIY